MKSLALLLFSLLLNVSVFSQNGVYLFGNMDNAPGTTFDISVVIYTSPPVTTQFTVNPDGDITNGNGNWVDLPSPDWSHFEVLYPTCNNETNILTVLADSLPNMIDVFYAIDYCPGGGNDILGCTDPNAINYSPNATLDDGTCFYDENTGCVDVNLDVFCVDTLSNAYDLTIADDPFCCETSWDQLCQQNYEAFGGQPLPECDEGEQDILGCTDPNALNYNSNATVDDGSCTYNDSCSATTAEILIITDQWGQEVSWNLYYEGVEIAGDGGYQGNSTYSYPLCLEDGCYTFEMYDSFGDGWNGATFSVMANGGVVAYGTLNTGNFGFVDFGINTTGCDSSNYVFGCTDPNAINYDPNATLDDGSCEYESDVENDFCADATELQPGTQLISNVGAVNNENVWGECWAFGNGEGEQSSIWYSFTTPDEPATIHIEASPDGTNTLTDTQFGLFEECGGEMIYCDGNAGQGLFSAFTFACGELETNTTYILMIDGYFGDMGTCYLTYDVSTNCEVLGCTDPEAINYDPSATVDDGSCEYETECTMVTMVLDGPSNNQGFFELYANNGFVVSGTYGGSDQAYEWCLEDGCYELMFLMNNGDSIAGEVVYTIFMGGSIIDGGTFANQTSIVNFGINSECDSIDVYGCTDPAALNYNPDATLDDGSCAYDEACVEVGEEFCVDTESDAYYVTVTQDSFCCTTQWDQICQNAYIENGGTAGEDCDIYGCTDPEALNFNPEATADDGSCEYSCTDIHLGFDFFNGAPADSSQMTWTIVNNNGDVVEDGFFYNWAPQYDFCLEDGCYTLTVFDVATEWDGLYNLFDSNQVLSQGTFNGDESTFVATFGVNAADCDDEDIYGCTDPNAINYNPNASVDDGSCEYEFDCGISFTVSPDTTGAQVIWITPSDNIYNAVSVEWDFGDGNTSNDLFPVHTYEGDGPYMLCLTATFEDNGGFCEITYCAELTDEMINPPGMQTEGFSINVVDPMGTTGVEETEWISELSLWPNPATDVVEVQFALHENTDVNLELYDAIGQMVYHSNPPSHSGKNLTSIDVGDLKPGMYFLRLNGNNEQMTTRLVVQ